MHRFLLFLFIVAMIAAGCSRPGRHAAELARAEVLCDSAPDRALLLLDSIGAAGISSGEERALHALLLSRALDCCDSFIASDSIIAPAVAYYRADRDPLRHTMTQYYLGRTLFHAGDLPRSIVAMYDGFHTAADNDLFFWKGMTARELATCFNHMRYYGEELKYDKIAYEALEKSGRRLHTRYALMDVGLAYHNAIQYDSAIIYVSQAIDSAVSNHDIAMEYEAKTIMCRSCYALGRYSEAIATCESMNRCGGMSPSDSAVLGLSLIKSGDTVRARAILDDIHGKEQLLSDYILLDLQKANGDYASALRTLTDIDNSTVSISIETSGKQIVGIVSDYYNSRRIAQNEEIQSNKTIILLVITCLGLTVAVAFFVIYTIQKNSRRKQNEKITLAAELKSAYEATAKNLEVSKTLIGNLMKTRYNVFNQILAIMNEDKNKEISREKFTEVVNKLIADITPGSQNYNALEQFINQNKNNIIADLRQDLPGLKDSDYALFSYTILGLSITSISILLNVNNINNVYNRKRRLKSKILTIESTRKNDYLAELA